jgi:RimJ/RimL family protein N-acetyltransferase
MNKRTHEIIINTPRLLLRTWRDTDLPLMAAINADNIVMEHFTNTLDKEATAQHIQRIQNHQQEHGYSLYAVELQTTNEFIGFVGLNHPAFDIPHFTPVGLPIVEIGWRLGAQHWQNGYATEAARAVIAYAFDELKLAEVISFTVVANQKSRRVMEKIGMRHNPSDDFDHPKLAVGHPLQRHVLYRLSREQYLTTK